MKRNRKSTCFCAKLSQSFSPVWFAKFCLKVFKVLVVFGLVAMWVAIVLLILLVFAEISNFATAYVLFTATSFVIGKLPLTECQYWISHGMFSASPVGYFCKWHRLRRIRKLEAEKNLQDETAV